MVGYGFHPEALLEYAEATNYYVGTAGRQVARAFVSRVESAIQDVRRSPARWRVVEESGIRRYILRRFPYALYYQWAAETEQITIYAVMHCSRQPGYWKHRLG